MANHFYGYSYHEQHTKDIKDFTLLDWVVFILFWALIVAAVVMGFLQKWGIMVILIGVDIIMIDVLVFVIMHANNKILKLFDVLGVFTIIAGCITHAERWDYLIAYGIILYLLVCFGLGGFFTYLAIKKNKKIKNYSLTVEAECEIVDIRRTNLFRYDDISSSPYADINANELKKPGFHYYVNGIEYYAESSVYYGDLNQGYEEGAKVMLRVNPSNPEEILPKNENSSLELIMGISWLLIGIVVTVVMAILAANGILTM